MNLISNGGFEVDTTGWAGSNATIAQDTGEAKEGDASCKVTSTGTSNASTRHANVETGSPLPMKTWTLNGYVKAEGDAIGRSLMARSIITGGAQAAAVMITTTITLTAAWQFFTITGTPDELDRTAIDLQIILLSPAGAGEVFYLDAVDIEELPSPLYRHLAA